MNKWFYVILTWHSNNGLSLYIDGQQKASVSVGRVANGLTPYSKQPNFVIGRGLSQTSGPFCGQFYLASLAVFKQFVLKVTVIQIYQFFYVNSTYCQSSIKSHNLQPSCFFISIMPLPFYGGCYDVFSNCFYLINFLNTVFRTQHRVTWGFLAIMVGFVSGSKMQRQSSSYPVH